MTYCRATVNSVLVRRVSFCVSLAVKRLERMDTPAGSIVRSNFVTGARVMRHKVFHKVPVAQIGRNIGKLMLHLEFRLLFEKIFVKVDSLRTVGSSTGMSSHLLVAR